MTTGVGRESGESSNSRQCALNAFSSVWATALLIAMTAAPGWFGFLASRPTTPRSLVEMAIVVVGLSLIVRPSGILPLAALAVLQFGQAVMALPDLPNHRWVVTFVHLAVVASMLGGFSFERFQASTRSLVVVCYSFAFLAKLNTDFLDPSTSCATRFYGNVAGWLPLPQSHGMHSLVIYGTLAAEGLLPLGLLMTRGRARATVVAFGVLFHLMLSLDVGKHFVNFSAVMTAALLLWLPADGLAGMERSIGWGRVAIAAGLLILLGFGFATALGVPLALAYLAWRHLFFSLWVLAILTLLALLPRASERPSPRLSLAAGAVVLFSLVNGLAPYLGLKTRTAFDMYSNLRLEADDSNHLVVPRSLDLLGLLDDRVRILQSDARGRQLGLEPGAEWPWIEVSRRLGQTAPPVVVYERGGERFVHDVRHGSRVDRPPWLLRKLLIFRPLGERTRDLCVW